MAADRHRLQVQEEIVRRTIALFLALLFSVPSLARHAAHKGVASWYGKREAGKPMANGQPFDPDALTCASRTYPFGTRLKVTFPKTGKVVFVTVTDRGPWIPGRVLDLSEMAAELLGLKPYGVGVVLIEEA